MTKKTLTPKIIIKEFTTKEEMLLGFPIIHQLYNKISLKKYSQFLDEMLVGNNYTMIGAFIEDKLVAVASYWILTRFYCGRYIQIGNMVVDHNHRSFGIGSLLLQYVEKVGRKKKCQKFILDSYTENKKSHPLYFREGFFIEGLHYMKNLD